MDQFANVIDVKSALLEYPFIIFVDSEPTVQGEVILLVVLQIPDENMADVPAWFWTGVVVPQAIPNNEQ